MLADQLLSWHDRFGRHSLPWQHPRTYYSVWLSEIMLQQTQVTTVIPYFEKFTHRFPDVKTLAAAELDEVLTYWSGLGYYARARNLHRSAVILMEEHDGHFPTTLEDWVSLPGVGRSTACAILSMVDQQALAILDGNVKRVLCRLFAVEGWPGTPRVEKALWEKAQSLVPETRPGDYTQAIMDLGALCCKRSSPLCGQCPLTEHCTAYQTKTTDQYPHPKPKREHPTRSALFFLYQAEHHYLLQRNQTKGLWGGLWLPPNTLFDSHTPEISHLEHNMITPLAPFTHIFSHFKLLVEPRLISLENKGDLVLKEEQKWVHHDALHEVALPAPMTKLFNKLAEGILQ